jgi:hypothetical protein
MATNLFRYAGLGGRFLYSFLNYILMKMMSPGLAAPRIDGKALCREYVLPQLEKEAGNTGFPPSRE